MIATANMGTHEVYIKAPTEDIKSLPNYDAWRINPIDNLAEKSWIESVRHLLGWAILAPSPHNKQGWVVRPNEEKRLLIATPLISDIGTPSDKKGRQTYIGVGCFSENLLNALHGYGLSPNYVVTPKEVRFKLDDLQSGKVTHPEVFQFMKKRKNYRGNYDSFYRLSEEVIKEVLHAMEKSSLTTKLITDRSTKSAIGEIQHDADRAVLMDQEFRYELSKHLVPNETQEARVMPGDTFGLTSESALTVHNALKKTGQFDGDIASGFARFDRDSLIDASATGIVSAIQDIPRSWIEAGMILERIWLIAEKHDLSVSVVAGMIESEAQNLELKYILGLKRERPTIIFKLGKALNKRPHSPRITVNDLFTSP